MNWLDVLLLLPILVGIIRGLMRGLVSEVIAVSVVVLGAVGAKIWVRTLSTWFLTQFTWPLGVCDVVAYILLFIGIAVVLSLLSRLLTKFIKAVHLGWVNRLFGGAFGACKYGIIVLIAVFVMDKTNESFHWLDDAPIVKTSIVYPRLVNVTHALFSISWSKYWES